MAIFLLKKKYEISSSGQRTSTVSLVVVPVQVSWISAVWFFSFFCMDRYTHWKTLLKTIPALPV